MAPSKSAHIKTPAFNTIGMCSLATFLFVCTFLRCGQAWIAVGFICTGIGLYASVSPGYLSSQLLIAPKYAGLISAWVNFISTFSQLLLPIMVGAVVIHSTASEWRVVFGFGSLIQVLSAAVFLSWGSAEEEEWAKSIRLNKVNEPTLSVDRKPAETARNQILTDRGNSESSSDPTHSVPGNAPVLLESKHFRDAKNELKNPTQTE